MEIHTRIPQQTANLMKAQAAGKLQNLDKKRRSQVELDLKKLKEIGLVQGCQAD